MTCPFKSFTLLVKGPLGNVLNYHLSKNKLHYSSHEWKTKKNDKPWEDCHAKFQAKKVGTKCTHQLKVGDNKFEGETKLPYVVHFPLIRNLHLWGAKLGQCNLYILVQCEWEFSHAWVLAREFHIFMVGFKEIFEVGACHAFFSQHQVVLSF